MTSNTLVDKDKLQYTDLTDVFNMTKANTCMDTYITRHEHDNRTNKCTPLTVDKLQNKTCWVC